MPFRSFIYKEAGSGGRYRIGYIHWFLGKTGDIAKAYLFQSARNRALNYLRDNEHFVPTNDFSSLERFENDDTLETRELQRLIQEAILSLPPKCQDIFNKSRMENLSNKDIADQMNIGVKAVEGHISRALKHIRAYLGDAYHYLW